MRAHDGAKLRRQQALGRLAHPGNDAAGDRAAGSTARACGPLSSVSSRGTSADLLGGPVPDDVPAQVAAGAGRCRAPRRGSPGTARPGGRQKAKLANIVARQDGREAPLVGQAAPGDVAGIERLRLGEQLRAHGRAEAVGADQHVGRLRRAVGEPRRYARRRLARRSAGPCPDDSARRRMRRRSISNRRFQEVAVCGQAPLARSPSPARSSTSRRSMGTPKLWAAVDAELRQGVAHLGMGHDAGAAAASGAGERSKTSTSQPRRRR